MPQDMSVADIEQKYSGSVVMYEKRPVLFKLISRDFTVRIFDLMGQKEEQVPFDIKKFLPPAPRIGMININGSVLYAARNAIRRYKLGISKENLAVSQLDVRYPDGRVDAYIRLVQGLERRELGECLLNKYPTLGQAVKRVSQFEGACAFDKQFCIDHAHSVFYKTTKVGLLIDNEVSFDKGFDHLAILLDGKNEKSY